MALYIAAVSEFFLSTRRIVSVMMLSVMSVAISGRVFKLVFMGVMDKKSFYSL